MSIEQRTQRAGEDVRQQLDDWAEEQGGWQIGHKPKNDADWLLELRLSVERLGVMQEPTFLMGRPPETPDDWQREIQLRDFELRLRDIERKWQNDLDERNFRTQLEYKAAEQAARGDNVRSYVLLAVVAAVVGTPIIAMLAGLDAEAFGQFLAPVTGIAGTVIGYWFGQRGGQTTVLTPPQGQTPGSQSGSVPLPSSSTMPISPAERSETATTKPSGEGEGKPVPPR
jgi:hypothetical protein